jgi:uncharacterized RDD family membrane protein YckC
MEAVPTTETYPRLLRRLQGVFIDGIIVPLAAMGTLLALTYAGVESTWVKVICPLAVIFALEPLAVSATGGTIGHHLIGLRVRKERSDERIGIFAAVIRLVVKTLFGLPAFFVAFLTRRRQGLHDLVARSLVVHKSTIGLPAYELLSERTLTEEHATYASVWRRLLVILLYWVLVYLMCNVALAVVLAGPCVKFGRCTKPQGLIALFAMISLLIIFIVLAVKGWRGKLWGCRKQLVSVVDTANT